MEVLMKGIFNSGRNMAEVSMYGQIKATTTETGWIIKYKELY
jgi:hypothetical protein